MVGKAVRDARPAVSAAKESLVHISGLSRHVPLVEVRVVRKRRVYIDIFETVLVEVRAREEVDARKLALDAARIDAHDLTWMEDAPITIGPNDCIPGQEEFSVRSVATVKGGAS